MAENTSPQKNFLQPIYVAKGERRLEWKFKFPENVEIIYIGRRLQCKDQELTMLTPGFFPRV